MRKKEETRRKNKVKRVTGNKIGAEGAKALSEMLKVNTTLTWLYLRCEEEEKRQEKEKKKKKKERMTGNGIEAEGETMVWDAWGCRGGDLDLRG